MTQNQRLFHVKFYSMAIGVACFFLLLTNMVRAYENEINNLASVMADKIANANKKTIAVVDFTDLDGNVTQLGRFVAEEISGALAGTGKGFEVVNRNNLKLILQEHKLIETGIIDPKSAMKLGEIAGVEALITGTITPFTENIRLSVSVLDITTAKVIDNKRIEIPRTKDINELLTKEITSSEQLQRISPQVTMTPVLEVPKQKVYENGFSFELQECKKLGSTVTCFFLITSEEQDQELYLYVGPYSTRMFDDIGNEYASQESSLPSSWHEGGHYQYSANLIAGVPMKAQAIFDGISPQAGKITVLELFCGIDVPHKYDDKLWRVQYRNISFSK